MPNIEIIEGADDVAVARWLASLLTAALDGGAKVAINVPGGSSPFPIMAELAKAGLDWPRVSIWPGDDRLVPEDNPASNIARIRERLEPAGARLVPLTEAATPPHFALTWLGMGADGHVASLFPNTDPQPDDRQRVRRITPDPLPPEAPYDRVTLTIPALLDSDAVVFVLRDPAKRRVFEAAARGENDLPIARLLRTANQPVTCFT